LNENIHGEKMPTDMRKTRKMRAKTTHGYGSKKKHRGKGSKGGKGYAGSHKHHMTYIAKYEPDHFGKHGFFSRKKKEKAINVEELEKMGEKDINLTEMGFGKLIGKGKVTKPVNVTVKKASKQAKEKIEGAKGKLNLQEETEEEFEPVKAENSESEDEFEEAEEETE